MTEEESLYLCNYPNYRETCIVPVYFVDSLPYIGDIERLYGRTSDQTFWTWTNGAWQQWAVGGGGSGLTFADLVEIIQEGDNVSIDIDLINETLTINATNFWEAEDATHIKPTISKTVYLERIDPTASAELTTISDTDKFSFWTTVWKRITWSNIKATLKSHFDSVYGAIETDVQIILDKDDWVLNVGTGYYEQSISITGLLSTSHVEVVVPTNRNYYNDYIDNQILLTIIATDTITFEAVIEPLADIVLNIRYIV